MRSQEVDFDEAISSLRQLGIPDVLPALSAAGIAISRTVLGGSHSVAIYPPIDSLTPLNPLVAIDAIGWGKETSLYVHIPFCETRCTFCHYAVDHHAGTELDGEKVERYLTALKRELTFWGTRFTRSETAVSSIYIGGGTPLVLSQAALRDLIHTIRNQFDVMSGAEVCIEGSPLTITAPDGEDKLRLLKELGVTRLSFGLQSFDNTVLKYAARGYRKDIATRACEVANDIFENWNLDLIQGLYKGSPSETWNTLQRIAEILPPHLTWYHGRFADRPQGRWYKTESKRSNFEDECATLLGRMLIWHGLTALGYHQIDGNRFVRARQYIDPFKKIRTSVSNHLLGVGPASYSHAGVNSPNRRFFGWVVRNEPDIRSYIQRVSTGIAPIATGRFIDQEELLAASYATGLRNGRVEDHDLRLLRFECPQLSLHYDLLVRELIVLGVLETYRDDDDEPGLQLSELGRLFEDETLALFFSPSVKLELARNASSGGERTDEFLDTVEGLS